MLNYKNKIVVDKQNNNENHYIGANECSYLANIVYSDDKVENFDAYKDKYSLHGWRAIDLKERKSPEPGSGGEKQTEVNKAEVEKQMGGFRAASFMNKETKEIVISFCGTDSPMDYPVDGAISLHLSHWQAWQAERYYKAIAKKYPGYKITLTGHSLGGALVQHVGSKYGLRGITFNAPGLKRSKSDNQTEKKSNIVNYVNMNDPIGCSFKHIGEVRYYLPSGIVDGKYKPHSDYIGADFSKYKPIEFKDEKGNIVSWDLRDALCLYKYDKNNKGWFLKYGAYVLDANRYTFKVAMQKIDYSNITSESIGSPGKYEVDGEESTIEVKDNKVVCSYSDKNYPIHEAIHKTVGGTVKGIQKGAEKTVNYIKKKTAKPNNSEGQKQGSATGGASGLENEKTSKEAPAKETRTKKEKPSEKEKSGKSKSSKGENGEGHWITTKKGQHIFIEDGVPRIRYFCYGEPMPILNTEAKEQQSPPAVPKGRREPEIIYSFAPAGYESEKDPAFEEYLKGERVNRAEAYYSGPYDAGFEAYLRGE